MAGAKHPAMGKQTGNYKGREVYPMRGHSWVPFMTSRGGDGSESIYGADEFMGWELFGRAALRRGSWKIVFMPVEAFGKSRWELFDLSIDPGETNDLADQMPEKLQEMLVGWEQYVNETGTVWGPPISGDLAWAGLPEDSVGGDPIAQTTAWMKIGENETPVTTSRASAAKIVNGSSINGAH